MFHLGKIKVWPSPALDKLFCIVVEEEGKVEDGGRDGGVVDSYAGLVEVPSPRSG